MWVIKCLMMVIAAFIFVGVNMTLEITFMEVLVSVLIVIVLNLSGGSAI